MNSEPKRWEKKKGEMEEEKNIGQDRNRKFSRKRRNEDVVLLA